MKVIKRDDSIVEFDRAKIVAAIRKANEAVDEPYRMDEASIEAIADSVAGKGRQRLLVEDIQDMVERGIMEMRGYEVAQKYVRYRYRRELTRKSNTTDNGILSLLLVAAMLLSLCACGQGDQPTSLVSIPENSPVSVPEEPAAPATMILTDNLGRQVELPCPVERCAVALRYTNELIRACGAIDKVIAVDLNTAQDRDYWGMFDPNEVIGKGQRELDYEKIVQLAPQVLILPANGSWEEAEEKLARDEARHGKAFAGLLARYFG